MITAWGDPSRISARAWGNSVPRRESKPVASPDPLQDVFLGRRHREHAQGSQGCYARIDHMEEDQLRVERPAHRMHPRVGHLRGEREVGWDKDPGKPDLVMWHSLTSM